MPPLSKLSGDLRREFHEALLDADALEDLPTPDGVLAPHAAGAQPEPPRPRGPSIYERRNLAAQDDEAGWTRVAEPDPLTGELHWAPDWERRAQGWVPLDEFPGNAGERAVGHPPATVRGVPARRPLRQRVRAGARLRPARPAPRCGCEHPMGEHDQARLPVKLVEGRRASVYEACCALLPAVRDHPLKRGSSTARRRPPPRRSLGYLLLHFFLEQM